MTNKFEEYPELAEMMQEYAAFGKFSNWSKFIEELNKALEQGQKLPIAGVVFSEERAELVCGECGGTITGDGVDGNCDNYWCKTNKQTN